MGKAIEGAMSNEAVNLIGKDTLPRSLALLERADIVLSPDSGPVHLANALGTPVIGLYACTWSRRSGPYNSLALCIDMYADAARQFLGKNPEDLRWGKRIEQDGVMDLIRLTKSLSDCSQRFSRAACSDVSHDRRVHRGQSPACRQTWAGVRQAGLSPAIGAGAPPGGVLARARPRPCSR
jgi:hypothetical protein